MALALMRELGGPGAADPDGSMRLSDLGMDSLSFAELSAALEQEFGLDLARADLDASNTVGEVLLAVERSPERAGPIGLPAGTGRLQRLADSLGGPPLGWWVGLRVDGAEHVPRSGPAIVAMNHESALDIPIAVLACPRGITFMAKRELFKNAFVAWALRELGGFIVERDRFDVAAVEMALAVLAADGVLGMYPEGTRSPGRLLPFLDGAAWLALRTGAPIVPCAISGTEDGRRASRPRGVRVQVSFALPIEVAPVADPHERRSRATQLTARLRHEISSRLPRREGSEAPARREDPDPPGTRVADRRPQVDDRIPP